MGMSIWSPSGTNVIGAQTSRPSLHPDTDNDTDTDTDIDTWFIVKATDTYSKGAWGWMGCNRAKNNNNKKQQQSNKRLNIHSANNS